MSVEAPPTGHDLSLCIQDLKAKKKEPALSEMISRGRDRGLVADHELLLGLLKLRERIGSTAIGKGVAIPNARSLTVREPRILVARSPRGIDWDAEDALPVSLVLMVLAPAECSAETWHSLLSRAAASARLQRTRQRILAAGSLEGVSSLMREVLA